MPKNLNTDLILTEDEVEDDAVVWRGPEYACAVNKSIQINATSTMHDDGGADSTQTHTGIHHTSHKLVLTICSHKREQDELQTGACAHQC